MSILNLSFSDICKSSNEFSFLSTIFDLVGNEEYKSALYDSLINNNDNSNTRIWLSLSAIGQELGGVFLQNINNFIDNLLNADTCGSHGLQSLANTLGINYTIFSLVNDFPNEIRQLIDVLSIKKEYLLDINLINKNFVSFLCSTCKSTYDLTSDYAISSAISINDYRLSIYDKYSTNPASAIYYSYLSSQWHTENVLSDRYFSTYAPELSDSTTLSAYALHNVIYNIFYDFIMSKLTMTYNDYLQTEIYLTLSNNILLSNFALYNPNAAKILQYKLLYNIDKKFNVTTEADKIDKGLSIYDDYTEYEKTILDLEFEYRHQPYDELQLQTRNKYYKEIEVREYFNFIRNEYLIYSDAYLYAQQYNIDQEYFVLSTEYDSQKSLLDYYGNIKTEWLSSVVDELVYITNNIRLLREQLKIFCQKNFMKGTFLLVSYLINEYLKYNTVRSLEKIKIQNPDIFNYDPNFNVDLNYNSLVEYIDPINYFNICAECDIGMPDPEISATLNKRYWQVKSSLDAIAAIDTTDIFSIPPTVNANMFAFDLATLSSFYCNVLNRKFKQYSVRRLSADYTDHLTRFLSYVFDVGADSTYRDKNDEFVFNIEDDQLSTYKEDLYWRYSGQKDGEFPYYYFTNTYHPSYQIHPYLSSFMEKTDYSYPILNMATVAKNSIIDMIRNKLSSYIDKDGYLQNMWNNPLGANQDYQSRYEIVDHNDDTNTPNPIIGYDGLFYPKAIYQLSNHFDEMLNMLSSNSVSSESAGINYYYHLGLSEYERTKISYQLTEFRSTILNSLAYSNSKTIYRYGLDMYLNAYIIVKEKNNSRNKALTNLELAELSGILWIRFKHHPIAFPAFALYYDGEKFLPNNIYSNVYSDYSSDSITNNALWNVASEVFQVSRLFKTPGIKDFNISIDRQNIIFVEKCKVLESDRTRVLLTLVEQIYFDNDELHIIRLSKIDLNTEYLFLNNSKDIEYKFACFCNISNKLAVYMYALGNKKIILIGSYYDYDSKHSKIRNISKTEIALEYAMKANTDVVFDATNDNTLVLSYITDYNVANVKNYINREMTYSQIDLYLTTTLKNCIAVKAFSVYNNFEQTIIDDNSTNSTALFNCYTDNGFFGILDGNNNICSTQLELELYNRGILKFQLLGPGKNNPIDFKLVLPVRMREGYSINDICNVETSIVGNTISCASYEYAHFEEDLIFAKNDAIAETIVLKYDPIEVNKILDGKSATLEVDEEYFIHMKFNKYAKYRLYDNTLVGPYLMLGNIPTKYYNPGRDAYKADPDKYFIKLFDEHGTLSVSWYLNSKTKEIQLDFNTIYYNNYEDNNYFNEKRNFLALARPGEAGYLNAYNANTKEDVIYYIKNISDVHPKFLLSAYIIDGYDDNLLITQDDKFILTLNDKFITT